VAKVTCCDGCGTTQGQFGKVFVGDILVKDDQGFLEIGSELLDLCVGCLGRELIRLVDRLDPNDRRSWVDDIRKSRGS
jgi:hypothetical protein